MGRGLWGRPQASREPEPAPTLPACRLALYVYEYLLHVGAQKSAQTFLSEVNQSRQQSPPPAGSFLTTHTPFHWGSSGGVGLPLCWPWERRAGVGQGLWAGVEASVWPSEDLCSLLCPLLSCPGRRTLAQGCWFPVPQAPGWAGAAPGWKKLGRAGQQAPSLSCFPPADPMGEEHYAGGTPRLPAFLVVVRVGLTRVGHGGGLGGDAWGNYRPPLPPTACSGTCTVQRPTAERHVSTQMRPRPSRTT